METAAGNILTDIPTALRAEEFRDLLSAPALRIERIVSTGQTPPPGEWLDQPQAEWVILLRGAAGLRFEHEEAARALKPGDWVNIPAHRRHRVEWTAADEPTVWLAVHYAA